MIDPNVIIVSFSLLTALHVSVVIIWSIFLSFASYEGIKIELMDIYRLQIFKTMYIACRDALGEVLPYGLSLSFVRTNKFGSVTIIASKYIGLHHLDIVLTILMPLSQHLLISIEIFKLRVKFIEGKIFLYLFHVQVILLRGLA